MTKKRSDSFSGKKTKDLQFIVENFLEKNQASITKEFENQRDEARGMALRLERLLFKDEFWMDQCDQEEHESTDFLKALHNWHRALKPLWNQIKKALLDYKEKVLPARMAPQNDQQAIPHELQGLLPYDPNQMDKYYQINLRSGAVSHVTMCFDGGRIDIHDRDSKIKNNFLDLIKGVAISLFGICRNCKKWIVITRKDKEHCPGCASSRWGKEKWNEDQVIAREKEKQRYRERRKKQTQQT